MKYLAFILPLLLVSCVNQNSDATAETPESSGAQTNIVDGYISTLETSVSDARNVTNTMNAQQQELQKTLTEMK